MSATPNLDAFRAALAASPEHKGWTDPLWALAYYEAKCWFGLRTASDLAGVFRDPELRGALTDLSTPEAAEAYLANVRRNLALRGLSWRDHETPFFEAVLEACA